MKFTKVLPVLLTTSILPTLTCLSACGKDDPTPPGPEPTPDVPVIDGPSFTFIEKSKVNEFTPSTPEEDLPQGYYTSSESKEIYYDAISKNKQLFADDFFCIQQEMAVPIIEVWPEALKACDLYKVTMNLQKADFENNFLSCQFQIEQKFNKHVPSLQDKGEEITTIELIDFPFSIKYDSELDDETNIKDSLNLVPAKTAKELVTNKNWKLNYWFSRTNEETKINNYATYDWSCGPVTVENEVANILSNFEIYSYYLSQYENCLSGEWTFVDNKGYHDYPYSQDPAPVTDPKNDTECKEFYQAAIAENEQILIDDLMWNYNYMINPDNLNDYSVVVKIISWDLTSALPRITYGVHLKYTSKEKGLYDYTFVFENIPIAFGYASDVSPAGWYIRPSVAAPALIEDPNWKYEWSGTIAGQKQADVVLTKESQEADIVKEIYREQSGWSCSVYPSRFLQNIPWKL